jgi:hypothetical protein
LYVERSPTASLHCHGRDIATLLYGVDDVPETIWNGIEEPLHHGFLFKLDIEGADLAHQRDEFLGELRDRPVFAISK